MISQEIKPYLIPSYWVDEAWPHVEPFLPAIIKSARGKLTGEDLRHICKSGVYQLWLAMGEEVIAVGMTEIIPYPKKRICRVIVGEGRQRKKWQHFIKEIESWARQQNCTGMQVLGRPGWQRVHIDYDATHVLLEKDLD